MYGRIVVGLDGSTHSNFAMNASLEIAEAAGSHVIGCHVYAAEMHRSRFNEMELGLPQRYQEESNLQRLRDTHEDIISGGMRMISDAYLAPLLKRASEVGVSAEGLTPEGRNYAKFAELIKEKKPDLAIFGAEGHGRVPESTLGSFAERSIFLTQDQDILLMRTDWKIKGQSIVVGVDGSENSYLALKRATEISKMFGGRVEAVAVYDPFFHRGVFSSISDALTDEQSKKFNFAAQQRLHDEIIDDGLLSLYGDRVDEGIKKMGDAAVKIEKKVVTGKVFPELSKRADEMRAGLLVVGRHGLHREPVSIIGSNSLALSRIAKVNLLIVANNRENFPQTVGSALSMKAEEVATPARFVRLKKTSRLAPGFHEEMVRGKIRGTTVEEGQRINVYIVKETEPKGRVRVDEHTELEFV